MSKVVVLGSNGMAGHVIVNHLKKQGHNVTTVARKDADVCLDIRNYIELNSFLHHADSICDYMINCIGVLVKESSDKPADAIHTNSWFPHFMEERLRGRNTKFIHISTDCVFSGKKGNYIETDVKDGEGMYAQSKALGEIINNKDLTIRTSIIGPELKNGTGLFHWFMNQKDQVNGFTNAMWGGVTTIELAMFIDWVMTTDITGLCHLTNNQKISKYDLLKLFNTFFYRSNITINPVEAALTIDKSIHTTRNDIVYVVPSYADMIGVMAQYMSENIELYKNYLH